MGTAGVRTIDEVARFALDTTSDAVCCLDRELRFTYVNASAARLVQRAAEDLIGVDAVTGFPEGVGPITEGYARALATGRPVTVEDRCERTGTWYEVRAFPDDAGLVIFIREVGDRRARHDDLTGLPNRLRLIEHLDDLAAEADGVDQLALLFLDVDGFKNVNDSLGHAVGDHLLCDLADRLRSAQRPTDLVARHGGDEFVIVAAPCTPAEADALAHRVQQALAEPFDVAGTPLPLSASIGIALARPRPAGAEDLVHDADTAMYAAKREGGACTVLFSPDLRDRARQRLEVVGGLSDALRDGHLELHYQPIIELGTDRVVAVEGLMRWNHPGLGLLFPDAFIPVAEETGLIVPMGRWALHAAALQGAAWQAAGIDVAVGVNISAEHFPTRTLVDDVAEALDAHGLAARHLVLELTETALARDFQDAIAQLHQVRALGVRVAIDDFGAGYSSLGRLASFPVDVLKFDASLIREASDRREHTVLRGIVQAVAGIAEAIGVETLAEGIETDAQRATAIELGCSLGQGYAIARPMPASEVAAFVRSASAG